ncbi:conserved hypothetical protein [Bacillus mycoides]|uniref:Uncharacterized protein n=1 Tax=Bacillus mycoides TaxID=1405 RepID=A0A653PAK7_BACMY|nr:conserved hypothetical protein [Bacillus mycoides]
MEGNRLQHNLYYFIYGNYMYRDIKGGFSICLKKRSIIGQKIIMHTLTMKKQFTSEYTQKEMMFTTPLSSTGTRTNGRTGNGLQRVHR